MSPEDPSAISADPEWRDLYPENLETLHLLLQEHRTQNGNRQGEDRDLQLDTREGQAGRHGDTQRCVVPLKLGNAG
jgi:hypothetical protein